MNIYSFCAILLLLASCKSGTTDNETADVVDNSKTLNTKTELPEYAYPVVMAHWKMGNPENTKKILDMYKAWDQDNPAVVASFYADSAKMDLPGGVRVTMQKNEVYSKWKKLRAGYDSTHNTIISAYALQNEDTNDDWVIVLTYNKWSYKDGVKDSMLYMDNWKLSNGKIVYLNTLEQQPPKTLLKKLENK